MKKILIATGLMLFMPLFSFADVIPQKIYAVAHSEINKNTVKNQKQISVYSYDDYLIEDIINIKSGEKITLSLDKYNPPQRGKRNGYYNVTYVAPYPEGLNKNALVLTGTMRVSTPKDKKEIIQKAGVTVVGQVLKVPGFTQAVAAAKGLIEPDENMNRIQSAGKNVYESTPLTYVEKGEDFKVEEDGIVVIKLKSENDEQ